MSADAWTVADPTVCPVCGRDSCDDPAHLPPVDEPPADPGPAPSAPRRGLHVERALDVITAPPPVEIVEGIASAGGLTVVASESGAGKTFVLLDLAAAISEGRAWHGRATRQGSVAYVSFEGAALGLRLRALRDVAGRSLEHVYIIRATDVLSPQITRDGELPSFGELALTTALATLSAELAAAGRPAIVDLVIDTVRASLAGSEDSSEYASAYLRAVRRIVATVPGAAGILAHHAGWQDGESQRKRERGSSAWRGNCDATLYLEAGEYDPDRGEAALTLRTLKARDGERPAPLHLIRRRVELAVWGDNGRALTSCVIARDVRTRQDREGEQTRAAETQARATDLRILQAIASRPEAATSQDRVRVLVGLKRDPAYEALARLLQRDWIAAPERQRQPYTVTAAGRAVLAEAATP